MDYAEKFKSMEYGTLRGGVPFCVCFLDWEVVEIDSVKEVAELRRGVYCFEGRHDAHRSPGPLYIGQGAKVAKRIVLGPKTSGALFYYTDENGQIYPYSAAWDIVVRHARVSDESQNDCDLDTVEDLLIKSHKPPYNNQGVNGAINRGDSEKQAHLILFNGGAKGHLLPVVSTLYFDGEKWPARQAPE
ncbi:MAG: hypothetical protein KF729_04945 [Sandaracinaceae bacterium]|nr:hypothetical protein [Sandaracinaceae bacterium]